MNLLDEMKSGYYEIEIKSLFSGKTIVVTAYYDEIYKSFSHNGGFLNSRIVRIIRKV